MSLLSSEAAKTTGTLIETSTFDSKNVDEPSTDVLLSGAANNFAPYGKPNAIVRPVRRIELIDEMESSSSPSNETNTTTTATIKPQQSIKVDLTKNTKQPSEIDSFTKELDFKLKHIQIEKKTSKNVNFSSV